MSVVHIPGPLITIGPRKIQRCSVCGEKLGDNLPFLQGRVAAVVVPGDKQKGPIDILAWPVGCPIRVDGNHTTVIPFKDGDQLPDDCCLALVEE